MRRWRGPSYCMECGAANATEIVDDVHEGWFCDAACQSADRAARLARPKDAE